jgi:hypothetical protein
MGQLDSRACPPGADHAARVGVGGFEVAPVGVHRRAHQPQALHERTPVAGGQSFARVEDVQQSLRDVALQVDQFWKANFENQFFTLYSRSGKS